MLHPVIIVVRTEEQKPQSVHQSVFTGQGIVKGEAVRVEKRQVGRGEVTNKTPTRSESVLLSALGLIPARLCPLLLQLVLLLLGLWRGGQIVIKDNCWC